MEPGPRRTFDGVSYLLSPQSTSTRPQGAAPRLGCGLVSLDSRIRLKRHP